MRGISSVRKSIRSTKSVRQMGIHSFVQSIFIAVILLVGEVTTTINAKSTTPDVFPFSTEQNIGPTKSLLMPSLRTETNGEERAITGLGKISPQLQTGTSNDINFRKLTKWLKAKQSADVTLAKLNLGNVDDALANSNLEVLNEYVTMFNKKYPGNPVSLLETLVTRYGDGRLAQALVTAKQQGRSMDIVEGLQSLQLKWWLDSQTSADDVFLRLNFKKDDILSSPKIATMVNYIDQFNSKFPDHQTDLFTTLKNGFGEGKFAIIAHSARAVDDPLAGFEHNLFQGWIKKKYSPEAVLKKVFKIDKGKLPTDGVEKSIIAAYEPVYYDALTSNLAHRVGPRRS